MSDKAIYECGQSARCGAGMEGGITKFQSRQMGGISKLDTCMIGGITKIPRPNSDQFCSPPLPLFRLCPLGRWFDFGYIFKEILEYQCP